MYPYGLQAQNSQVSLIMQFSNIQKYSIIILMINNYYAWKTIFQQSLRMNFANLKFKYTRDIAKELKIQVPRINQQLGITSQEKCWLIGYRKIVTVLPLLSQQQQQNQQETTQEHIEFIKDPSYRQQLSYCQIQRLAQQKDLDIFYTNENQKQVELINFSSSIYRKYFIQNLFKKNSTAKKYKQIRIPQKIEEHDLKMKAQKIQSMVKKGDYRMRLVTQNQSELCEKNLVSLCKLLGKQDADIKVQEEVLREKIGRKPKITIDRFTALLDFSDAIEIDYQKVNKKWRRKILSQKFESQKFQQGHPLENLHKQSVMVQREILAAFRKSKAPFPKQLAYFQQLQNSFSNGFQSYFKTQLEKNQNQQSSHNQDGTIEKDYEIDQDQNEQDEEINEKREKQNRRNLGLRTVNDILSDMEQLRGDKTELDQFQQYKMKKLQQELKLTLKIAGYGKSL